jgi:hypothetical protein
MPAPSLPWVTGQTIDKDSLNATGNVLQIYNNSAITLTAGMAVALDPTFQYNMVGVILPGNTPDMRLFGVVASASIPSHGYGLIYAPGYCYANIWMTGTIVWGHSLISYQSGSGGYAFDSGGGGWGPGILGWALGAQASGTALLPALLHPYPLFLAAAQSLANSYTNTTVPATQPATVISNLASAGSNRFILALEHNQGVANIFTFNGAGLTSLQDGTAALAYLGYLANPAIATANVLGNIYTNGGGAIVLSMTGVNQSTPVGALGSSTGTSASVSLTVACVPGDYVVGCVIATSNVSISGGRAAGQNNIQDILSTANRRITMDYMIATGNSVTFTWTLSGSATWDGVGVAVKSA